MGQAGTTCRSDLCGAESHRRRDEPEKKNSRGGARTRTSVTGHRILSPVRLPISPLGRFVSRGRSLAFVVRGEHCLSLWALPVYFPRPIAKLRTLKNPRLPAAVLQSEFRGRDWSLEMISIDAIKIRKLKSFIDRLMGSRKPLRSKCTWPNTDRRFAETTRRRLY